MWTSFHPRSNSTYYTGTDLEVVGICGQDSTKRAYSRNPGGADKIIHEICDIATCPKTTWYAQTGIGEIYTRRGDPAKWVAFEVRAGVRIRVVYQPAIGKVITAFPDDTPMLSLKTIE
ncbi:EndoU domain-containing protein [Xanthomonas axonopodis pv. vasculorum]|uniref:EndoU domain-containing protein n=1 Tax=Xanthomonas axonopodis TaxID=53413 RepID=UPI001FCFECFF|nr:EndoU domain-containing protein [Xanthomonas axonopodis]